MRRSSSSIDSELGLSVPAGQHVPTLAQLSKPPDGTIQIGNTRCYGPSAHGNALDIIQAFPSAIRIVGGIPERHVMSAASHSLVKGLLDIPGEHAFLVGCTQTRREDGTLIDSIPGKGIELQQRLLEAQRGSRVLGTLPGDGSAVDGTELVLRHQTRGGHRTIMHPGLREGILFNEWDSYNWNNEAIGVVRLARQALASNPSFSYHAIIIGGGVATRLELHETIALAKQYPERVNVVLLWNTGGIARQAAERVLSPSVTRAALTSEHIVRACSRLENPVLSETTRRIFATAVQGRAIHQLSHHLHPDEISNRQPPVRALERTLHVLAEGAGISESLRELTPGDARAGSGILTGLRNGLVALANTFEHDRAVEAPKGGGIIESVLRSGAYSVGSSVLSAMIKRNDQRQSASIRDGLAAIDVTRDLPLGAIIESAGQRYVTATNETGDRVLVGAVRGSVVTISPLSLVGEVVVAKGDVREQAVAPAIRSTVPVDLPRWESVQAGTLVQYHRLNGDTPFCHDEILTVEKSQDPDRYGSHWREVVALRVHHEYGTCHLRRELRNELSLTIPPQSITDAHSVRVFPVVGASSGNISTQIVDRGERLERLPAADLEAAALRVVEQAVLKVTHDTVQADLLRFEARLSRQERGGEGNRLDSTFDELLADQRELRERAGNLARLVSKWCSSIEFSTHTIRSSYIQHLCRNIETLTRKGPERSVAWMRQSLIDGAKGVTVEPVIRSELVRELGEFLDVMERTKPPREPAQLFRAFSKNDVSEEALRQCEAIGRGRIVEVPAHATIEEVRAAYARGGFMYSEYTRKYLEAALSSGALLLTCGERGKDESVAAFLLVHPAGKVPAVLSELIPLLQDPSQAYLEVLASNGGRLSPLANRVLPRAALLYATSLGASRISTIINNANTKVQNLAHKLGFEARGVCRVLLNNPLGGEEGIYSVFERDLMKHTPTKTPNPTLELARRDGYLSANPEEYAQMMAVIKQHPTAPFTRISFGVDSIQGEALKALNAFISNGAFSGLSGIISRVHTRQIIRIESESSDAEDSIQWTLKEARGDAAAERLMASRSAESVVVGLSLHDPKDPLSGTSVWVTDASGARRQCAVMRGDDLQRTIFDESEGERIRCKVRFPASGEHERIWQIGGRRSIEFGLLAENRMSIFAGGGVAVRHEIELTVAQALEAKSGMTHVVLLKGTEAVTDHVADNLAESLPAAFSEEGAKYVTIHVVDVRGDPDAMQQVLRSTGRL